MIEILILFQNLCLEIGELHNWEWINWGLVQTAINQIWLGEKSGNMKVFTTNHQHQDCYKISTNCYKISSKVSPNIIKIVTNIIKIVTKYHQDCYQISSQSSSDVPLPSPPWSIRSFDGLLFKIVTKYLQKGYKISSRFLQNIIKIVIIKIIKRGGSSFTPVVHPILWWASVPQTRHIPSNLVSKHAGPENFLFWKP